MKKRYLAACLLAGIASPKARASGFRIVDRVVLVHGMFGNSSQMDPVRKRLEKQGFECLSPSLKPADGRAGLDQLAAVLKQQIDSNFNKSEPFAIIAYSMGGIISRQYLQNLGGAGRCAAFITISSPHHGSNAAWLYPGKGAAQMRPGSEFLAALDSSDDKLGKIEVVSYRTPLDLMILPSKSSIWDRAENLHFPVAMHPLMLRSDRVLSDIEKRLLK